MKLLQQRILKDGHLKEGNILKVDSFLNQSFCQKVINDKYMIISS